MNKNATATFNLTIDLEKFNSMSGVKIDPEEDHYYSNPFEYFFDYEKRCLNLMENGKSDETRRREEAFFMEDMKAFIASVEIYE